MIRRLFYHLILRRPTPQEIAEYERRIAAEERERQNEIERANHRAFTTYVREGGWRCVIDDYENAKLAGEAWFISYWWDGPKRMDLAKQPGWFNIADLYWLPGPLPTSKRFEDAAPIT